MRRPGGSEPVTQDRGTAGSGGQVTEHHSLKFQENSGWGFPADILHLQRWAGNRAVTGLFRPRVATTTEAAVSDQKPSVVSSLGPVLPAEHLFALQRALGNRTVGSLFGGVPNRVSRVAPAITVQRFTEDDVNKRAFEIWQKKGSPPNQSKEEQDRDYFEARRQLEIQERAHGVWEEKGKQKDQSEEQRQRNWSEAEFQIDAVKEANAAANEKGLESVLAKLAKGVQAFGWKALRYVFKAVSDPVKALIRSTQALRNAAFALCPIEIDKGELLYMLGGDSPWKRATMQEQHISDNAMRQALVDLKVFEVGTAGHKEGKEVDELIKTHLRQHVEQGLEARGKIEGHVAVLGDEDWDVIGRSQYGNATWDGGKKHTLNAFVDRSSDPPRVFVNKNRGNAGTAIHEGCHMWGSPNRPINGVSHNLNEGVTEYFARKICTALGIPRAVYAQEFAIANRLVAVVGEQPVAEAFFDGNLASLSGQWASPQGWNNFTTFVEQKAYAQAAVNLDHLAKKDQTSNEDLSGAFGNLFG